MIFFQPINQKKMWKHLFYNSYLVYKFHMFNARETSSLINGLLSGQYYVFDLQLVFKPNNCCKLLFKAR